MIKQLCIQFVTVFPIPKGIIHLKERFIDIKKERPAKEAINENLQKINKFRIRHMIKPLSLVQEKRLAEILTDLNKNNVWKSLLDIQRVLLEED